MLTTVLAVAVLLTMPAFAAWSYLESQRLDKCLAEAQRNNSADAAPSCASS